MVDRIWDRYPERRERMAELCQKIRPVARFAHVLYPLSFKYQTDDGALYYVKPVDPFTVAFMANPRPDRRARYLKKLRHITTYHTWKKDRGYFSPTIAEVIAQIPEELLATAIAFEIMERPETRAEQSEQADIAKEGYHRGTTLLYTKRDMSAPWTVANGA